MKFFHKQNEKFISNKQHVIIFLISLGNNFSYSDYGPNEIYTFDSLDMETQALKSNNMVKNKLLTPVPLVLNITLQL